MAPKIRKPAPAFTNVDAVVDGEFKKISLADYKGKYVVLFFYPLDFTFVCPTEIIAFSEKAAFRNASMQGGYFILAARAVGLDCGPMSGFDNAKVDAAFFPDGRWKSNFLCNLGYGDPAKLHPRAPRLAFEEVCRIE